MNKLAFPILAQLADGKFHSGETLAQQFGVTRATIFNAIREAQAMGVTVFSVQGKGYRLPQPVILLTPAAILRAMGAQATQIQLLLLAQVDSTNRYLMQESGRGAQHGSCVVAMIQTAGRGRRGRQWVSQLGGSLTFSLLWRFQSGAAALSGLSLVVGLALLNALHGLGFHMVKLKWPNDLLVAVNGVWHKLGGILIELQGDMEGPSAAVIGVGLNLAIDAARAQQIDQACIGLNQLQSPVIDPNWVLGRCLQQLAIDLPRFAELGFSAFKDDWLKQHAFHQQPVHLHMSAGAVVPGVVVDVANDGSLIVDTDHGLQTFHAGEISVRGAQ